MKRSEMLLKLQECMVEAPEDIEEAADYILKRLEKYGMLPPGWLKPIPFESDGKQYPLVPGDFKNEQGVWCTPGYHGWEQE